MDESYRVKKILEVLKQNFPNSTALNFSNPFELLIATILSAQTTDTLVNKKTAVLFKKYKTPDDLASADINEVSELIKGVNFYKNKARYIVQLSKILVSEFDGKVPSTMDQLTKLPGVARKTANVVLAKGFGKAEGIVVDTHVKRVSYRLGFTKNTDPEKIEKDLMGKLPKEEWADFPFRVIWLGRKICTARKAYCEKCPLKDYCPKVGVK